MSRTIKIVFWGVTGLLGLQMVASGIGDLLLAEQIVENISHVGFPLSLVPFLGALKIIGTIVLVFVANLHLKIATYAGMFFYSIGAVYSHVAIGDPTYPNTVAAILMLLLVTSSYLLWQKYHFPFTSVEIGSSTSRG